MSREQYMPLGTSRVDDQPVAPITPFSMSNKQNVHSFISDDHRNGTEHSADGHEMKPYSDAYQAPHSQSKLINHRPDIVRNDTNQKGMKGTRTTIGLSMILLFLPLVLSAVMVYLVYANLELPNGDLLYQLTIEEKGLKRRLADHEYYVNYSATRLVFISSLSSTLALALVPIAMTLFSFTTASTWQKNSFGDVSNLPTPFQFKISLQLIQGGMLDFFSYIKYLCSRKKSVVPDVVHRAGIMLGLTLLLALAITLVDALLHIDMDTVTYSRVSRNMSIDFSPGRRLPEKCYNGTSLAGFPYNLTSTEYRNPACNIISGGSGASQSFTNTTEAYKVMANASTRNFIQLSNNPLISILTTPKSPDGVSFSAQSFASASICEMITNRCDITYDGTGCNACQEHNFTCTPEKSGVFLKGTISDPDLALAQGSGSFIFNFWNTSAKDYDTSKARDQFSGVNGKIYSAFPFVLARRDDRTNLTAKVANGQLSYDPNLQLFASTYGNLYGILSCNTTMYDMVYNSTVNGTVHEMASTAMNDTATAPFLQTIQMGREYIRSGLNLAGASAQSDKDLAYQFGRVLDRTLLGMTSGALLDEEAINMYQASSKLVAKVPRPEFIALIALNCVMPLLGILLGIYDFILIKKHGVAHLQARLGLGGVVAALFEDERLNADARSVEELYAEKRGMATSRIAVQGPGPGQIMFAALHEK